MAYSESLVLRIRHLLRSRKDLSEKKMFGGVGFLLQGHMCVGVWKDSLIVRLGSDQADEVRGEPFVGEFDITGRPMKGWLLVSAEGLETDEQLRQWIDRAVTFARTLPAK